MTLLCLLHYSGLSASDSEVRFIDRVRTLESYGIDPQPAKVRQLIILLLFEGTYRNITHARAVPVS